MKIAGNRRIAASQAVVESVLLDGQRLAEAIPDFQPGARLDEQYQRDTLTVLAGPLRGQYGGTFTVVRPATAVWEITFDGHSDQGIFHGYGRLDLTSHNEHTIIHYEGDVDVDGQLAGLPPRLLHANVNAIVRRCLDGIERVLWPENFTVESESAAKTPVWLKTAVPAALAVISAFLLSRLISKRLK